MSQAYDELLTSLANEIGLEPADSLLATQELVIDGITVSLVLEGGDGGPGDPSDVVMFSLLGVPAPQRAPGIRDVLLEANHLWVGTGGATLGLMPSDGNVSLCVRAPLERLSGASLASMLDAFVDSASHWQRFIRGGQTPGLGGEAAAPIGSLSV